MTQTSDTKFNPKMTMEEAVRVDGRVKMILQQFHIGGCHHCGFEEQDTIEKVATDNGVPVDVLLNTLNSACR
jgi:hypothetical protein